MTYPPLPQRVRLWVPVCLWAALGVSGCAVTAPVSVWQPAGIDVDGMKRLAVLSFTGENGHAVAASLTSQLWENQFYTLVDRSDLRPVQLASAPPVMNPGPADYLDSARERHVDGLIVGDVIEYRCDDQVLSNTEIHLGADRAEDAQHGLNHEGVDVGVSHTETVHREATVAIAFRLVEVDTGKVRATRKTSHHFQGDIDAGSGPLPTKGEVLDELTQRCIDEFVALLAPHEVELRLPLARCHWFQRGQALVGKGNDFAKRGRWDEAIAAWRQAIEVNPANDAALYNLAVAHAARQEYTLAEDYAIQAINIRHKDLYDDGLATIRQFAKDHEETLRQRQQAVTPHVTPLVPHRRERMASIR